MRKLGSSGIDASAVGFGAWAIGGWMWGSTDEKDAIACVHACLDVGVNFIDTAPLYGFGVSENIIAKAIRGRREKYVIATKCGMVTHTDGGQPFFNTNAQAVDENGAIQISRNLSPKSIRGELEKSLKRLGTDYVDLYQTHTQDPSTPIEETMDSLLTLKREGKIRGIGVSNATVDQIKKYQAVGPLDSDQERYSMIDREAEQDLLPHLRETKVSFLAYSPLAMGLLTGKLSPDRNFSSGDTRLTRERFSPANREKTLTFIETSLRECAERYQVSISSLVVGWTIDRPGVTHVLCGARSPEQFLESAKGGRLELTQEDRELIDTALQTFSLPRR